LGPDKAPGQTYRMIAFLAAKRKKRNFFGREIFWPARPIELF
jgi:hypothetical protein